MELPLSGKKEDRSWTKFFGALGANPIWGEGTNSGNVGVFWRGGLRMHALKEDAPNWLKTAYTVKAYQQNSIGSSGA